MLRNRSVSAKNPPVNGSAHLNFRRESRSRQSHDNTNPNRKKSRVVPLDLFEEVITVLKADEGNGLTVDAIVVQVIKSLSGKVKAGRQAVKRAVRMLKGCAYVRWFKQTWVAIKEDYLEMEFEQWKQQVFFPKATLRPA